MGIPPPRIVKMKWYLTLSKGSTLLQWMLTSGWNSKKLFQGFKGYPKKKNIFYSFIYHPPDLLSLIPCLHLQIWIPRVLGHLENFSPYLWIWVQQRKIYPQGSKGNKKMKRIFGCFGVASNSAAYSFTKYKFSTI